MRYIALSVVMLGVAGCSLPSAVSEGFDDISRTYEEHQAERDYNNDMTAKYGVDSNSNRALVAFSKGDMDVAQDYATKALQENPTDVYALMLMAVVNDSLGMANKAGFYYQAVLDTKSISPTTLGNYRLNLPESLYESAFARLKVIDLKQAPFIVNQNNAAAPVFEIKEVYMTAAEPVKTEMTVAKTGMDLFSTEERNIISRFLTLKSLAEKGYITKEEFIARRMANIGGLLPLTKPMPAMTVTLPVPSTDAIIDRFNSMKNAYELKSMSAAEYIGERDVILEALLPITSMNKMPNVAPPANLLEGADDFRKLDVLFNLELITRSEVDGEKREIENILRMGGRPLPTSMPAVTVPAAVKNVAPKSNMPTPLIPVKR